MLVVGEDGEKGAEAAFFHGDGGRHDVKGAEGERAFRDVGEDLWGQVVEGGLEDGDGAGLGGVMLRECGKVVEDGVRWGESFGGRKHGGGGLDDLADGDAEDVGETRGVASAGAIADVADRHGRLWAEGGVEGAEEGGAGGGDELVLEVGGVGGQAAEEVGGGGGGDGEVAVGAVNGAATDVKWRAVPDEGLAGVGDSLLVKGVDAGRGAGDVDDGVDGADLVKVDVVYGDVVDPGFGVAEELKGVDGEVLDGLFESGGADEIADGGQGAAVHVGVLVIMRLVFLVFVRVFVLVPSLVEVLGLWVVMMFVSVLVVGFVVVWVLMRCVCVPVRRFGEVAGFEDVNLGGGDAGAVDPFDLERRADVEGADGIVENVCVKAGIEQGAEEHVAGDAGEAVEVGETHAAIVSCGGEGMRRETRHAG